MTILAHTTVAEQMAEHAREWDEPIEYIEHEGIPHVGWRKLVRVPVGGGIAMTDDYVDPVARLDADQSITVVMGNRRRWHEDSYALLAMVVASRDAERIAKERDLEDAKHEMRADLRNAYSNRTQVGYGTTGDGSWNDKE